MDFIHKLTAFPCSPRFAWVFNCLELLKWFCLTLRDKYKKFRSCYPCTIYTVLIPEKVRNTLKNQPYLWVQICVFGLNELLNKIAFDEYSCNTGKVAAMITWLWRDSTASMSSAPCCPDRRAVMTIGSHPSATSRKCLPFLTWQMMVRPAILSWYKSAQVYSALSDLVWYCGFILEY